MITTNKVLTSEVTNRTSSFLSQITGNTLPMAFGELTESLLGVKRAFKFVIHF
jgi:hypothetical protein